MSSRQTLKHIYADVGQIALLVLSVFFLSFYNKTLSYSLVQIISIVVSFGIFAIAWNSRKFIVNKFFVFVGTSFFFVSFIETLHLFSFEDFSVFGDFGRALEVEFWILARLLESASLFLAVFYISRPLKSVRLFYLYALIIAATCLLIFWQPSFIFSYAAGPGAGLAKALSEVVIIFLYIGAAIGILINKKSFNSLIFTLFVLSIILNIGAELILSFYLDMSSAPHLLIYSLKIVSFSLLYIAVVEMGLRKPYSLLFKELKDAEKRSENQVERLQELTDDLAKFKIAVENTVDSVIITDKDNNILFANQAAEIASGYGLDDIIGRNMAAWGEQMKSQAYKEIWRRISQDGGPFRGEIQKSKKGGDAIIVDAQVYPLINNGESRFYVYIERDMTKAKQMDAAKSEFISLASHQLRTPLTSTALASELLMKSVGDSVTRKQKEYLQEICDSTGRMTALINNLLNVSRIDMDSFSIRLELVDVISGIDQIIKELDSQIKGKHLKLTKEYSDEHYIVSFDRDILRIVIENLLTNAIIYTPAGGRIGVKVQASEDKLLVAVSDTGYGIPPASRDKIFSKFFRADNAREVNSSGNGLGLYIAKEMAEKVGARLWFELPEQGGTTFFLSIPIKKPL